MQPDRQHPTVEDPRPEQTSKPEINRANTTTRTTVTTTDVGESRTRRTTKTKAPHVRVPAAVRIAIMSGEEPPPGYGFDQELPRYVFRESSPEFEGLTWPEESDHQPLIW